MQTQRTSPSWIRVPTQANTDGYNYEKYKDGIADFMYNQLWYFNFLDDRGTPDTSDDIAGVGAYGLANPEHKMFQKGMVAGFGMIIRDPLKGIVQDQYRFRPGCSGQPPGLQDLRA